MERWLNKVAVVTGASAGIGAAIVKDLVNAGLQVVGLARRVELVEALRQQLPAERRNKLHAYKCDVSKLESVNEAFDWIIEQLGGVDILINNAGCFHPGQLLEMDVADVQTVLQTNVMGVVHCTQRAFKSIRERKVDGHVVIINSIAGHKVLGGIAEGQLNIYSPTKFALTALNEVYLQELNLLGNKTKITSISPGYVNTDIVPEETRKAYGHRMLKPEDISQGVMYAIATPPHVMVHELTIKPIGEAV